MFDLLGKFRKLFFFCQGSQGDRGGWGGQGVQGVQVGVCGLGLGGQRFRS